MTDTSSTEVHEVAPRGAQDTPEKRQDGMLSKLFSLSRKSTSETLNECEQILQGHTCLVTGASRGIGEQIAIEFAKRGAALVLAAQDEARLTTVAEKCRNHGAESCHSYIVNLFSRQEVENLANEVLRNHGHIHVLVNNAGIAAHGGLTALKGDPIEWEQVRNSTSFLNKIFMLSSDDESQSGDPNAPCQEVCAVHGRPWVWGDHQHGQFGRAGLCRDDGGVLCNEMGDARMVSKPPQSTQGIWHQSLSA